MITNYMTDEKGYPLDEEEEMRMKAINKKQLAKEKDGTVKTDKITESLKTLNNEEEIKQVSLKDLMEQKNKEKETKKAYSFRFNKELMNKIESYTEKAEISKTGLLEKLLNDFLKNRVIERQTFDYYMQVKKDKEVNTDIKLNNKLDIWDNGSYHSKYGDIYSHEGLEILITETKTFFILLKFDLFDISDSSSYDNVDCEFISIDRALELAINRNNIQLEDEILKFYEPNTLAKMFNEKNEILHNHIISKKYENIINSYDMVLNDSMKKDKKIEKLQDIVDKQNKLLNTNMEDLKEKLKEQIKEEIAKELKKFQK